MTASRVYFCFHYDDVETFRANVVRNHSITKDTGEACFFDASIWEDAELHGDAAVKGLINRSLENTSATCALIGSETWRRRWVRYEIFKSYDRGNKLFGVHINGVKDKYQQTYAQGRNPFGLPWLLHKQRREAADLLRARRSGLGPLPRPRTEG